MAKILNHFSEVCANCGLTLGSHRGDHICYNQCPSHEGRMDWNMEYITVFAPTGEFKDIPWGTPRHN